MLARRRLKVPNMCRISLPIDDPRLVRVREITIMSTLNVKSKTACMWDLVSLGEVMLRLDPGDGRISTARHFRAWEGGGEYNVARRLWRCFRMGAGVCTSLADNPVGRLLGD